MTSQKLTLDDIADLRAYERERDEFRDRIIQLKKLRRVQIGPIVTVLFENRDTIRFQVQEMARAERMLSDDAIQHELDVYNPLIPSAGELTATLFIELTSKGQLMEWLPKLVGIERSIELQLGEDAEVVRSVPDGAHAAQLTREEITASVHYIRLHLTDGQIERLAAGPAWLAANHPAYQERVLLPDDTRASLVEDLRG
ncbi:MAG: hypothetical protein JWO37_1460 [Acidimicrobiales bacterium]|jgi:hypothetical protein|nr:hypothetical protein [Acidimicrobiales bacterium]